MSKNENKANALTDEDLGNISGGTSNASEEDIKAYEAYVKKGIEAQNRGANLYIGNFEYWEKHHKKRNTSQN